MRTLWIAAALMVALGARPALSADKAPKGKAEKEAKEKPAKAGKDSGEGEAIYMKSCRSCHGKAGEGNPGMAKMFKLAPEALVLTGKEVAEKSDAELAELTSKGEGRMPAFGTKLKEAEIGAVVAYIRSLGTKKGK